MAEIREDWDDWSEKIFKNLAVSTWIEHFRTTDDEQMPTLPTIEDVRHAMVEGELEKALPEFIHRIHLIVAAFPIPSAKFPDVLLPSTYIPEAQYGWMLVRLLMLKKLSRLALTFEDCHKLWYEARKFQPVKHPLSPLILTWFMFMRPLPIEPSQKNNGVLPLFRAVHDSRSELPLNNLPDMTGAHGEMTAYLPGFEPQTPSLLSAPILYLYDYLGGTSLTRGRTAPLTLRIFYEAIMSVPLEGRQHRRYVDLTLRDLRDWLYPDVMHPNGRLTPSIYKPSKHFKSILRALQEVHNLRVEVVPTGDKAPTLWQPVSLRALPTKDLDSRVSFEIYLPPGSSHGALVEKHILRALGRQSALKYRAYIGLSYYWDKYGRTKNGQREIVATRPVTARNAQGLLVNSAGVPILNRQGKPERKWKLGIPLDENSHPTDFAHAAREINPSAISHYPVLTDDDLLELCYNQPDGNQATGNNRLDKIRLAKRALHGMLDARYIHIVEDSVSYDGERRGWQIFPP